MYDPPVSGIRSHRLRPVPTQRDDARATIARATFEVSGYRFIGPCRNSKLAHQHVDSPNHVNAVRPSKEYR